MKFNLRLLYLYLFSFVGLLITVIGSIQIVDLTIKTYVFRVSDYTYFPEVMPMEEGAKPVITQEEARKRNEAEESNQRKRQLSNSLAMIIIGVPLYLYHWKTIKQESKSQ